MPALDGVRGIAVLLVIAGHFEIEPINEGAAIGVAMFFTLSGFLITTLLLEERHRAGRVDQLAFYRRRARRLLPALAAVLVVVGALTAAGLPTGVEVPMVVSIVGYASNWYLLATQVDGHVAWNALGHTWTLAIEEQFYIVWPFLLTFAAKWRGRRGVLWCSVVGAVASAVWAVASGRSTLHTDVSAYGLLVGCALAAWLGGGRVPELPRWAAGVSLASIGVLVLLGNSAGWVPYVLVPLLTAVVIAVTTQVEVRWLSARSAVWIGRRSYGLYLWNFPVAYLAYYAKAPWPVVATLGIAISFGLAAASWRWIEEPFLRRGVVGRDPRRRQRGAVDRELIQ